MNVAVALLSALVVLPPMLVWAEERGWVTRGLLHRGRTARRSTDGKEYAGRLIGDPADRVTAGSPTGRWPHA